MKQYKLLLITLLSTLLLLISGCSTLVDKMDNVTTNTKKTEVNGKLNLSIGTLKGTYEVTDFHITQSGLMEFPVKASVDEGEYDFLIQKGDEVVLSQTINDYFESVASIDVEEGEEYTIVLKSKTEKAKGIKIEVNLR